MERHLPYGITQCYLPPDGHRWTHPALTPAKQAGILDLLIPDGWKAEIFYKLLSSVANWQISQICGNCLGIISRRIRHEDFTLPLAVFLLVSTNVRCRKWRFAHLHGTYKQTASLLNTIRPIWMYTLHILLACVFGKLKDRFRDKWYCKEWHFYAIWQ